MIVPYYRRAVIFESLGIDIARLERNILPCIVAELAEYPDMNNRLLGVVARRDVCAHVVHSFWLAEAVCDAQCQGKDCPDEHGKSSQDGERAVFLLRLEYDEQAYRN